MMTIWIEISKWREIIQCIACFDQMWAVLNDAFNALHDKHNVYIGAQNLLQKI